MLSKTIQNKHPFQLSENELYHSDRKHTRPIDRTYPLEHIEDGIRVTTRIAIKKKLKKRSTQQHTYPENPAVYIHI